jgi:hypothetical protein
MRVVVLRTQRPFKLDSPHARQPASSSWDEISVWFEWGKRNERQKWVSDRLGLIWREREREREQKFHLFHLLPHQQLYCTTTCSAELVCSRTTVEVKAVPLSLILRLMSSNILVWEAANQGVLTWNQFPWRNGIKSNASCCFVCSWRWTFSLIAVSWKIVQLFNCQSRTLSISMMPFVLSTLLIDSRSLLILCSEDTISLLLPEFWLTLMIASLWRDRERRTFEKREGRDS